MDTAVDIIGWGHTPFGKLPGETLESLIVAAAREALDSARTPARDIDEIFIGTFNSGLVPLSFPASLALQVDDELLFTPATRVENACATGSAALFAGVRSIQAGHARRVLVIGVEKMTHAPATRIGAGLLGADYDLAGTTSTTGFAGLFATVAQAYFAAYGDHSDVLAMIAAKSHHNAVANPYAHLRVDLGYEFCREVSERNPLVADPLRRTDCAPVSDGAAAVVLAAADATEPGPAVRITGMGHANDYLPTGRRDPLAFAAARVAWIHALDNAGMNVLDLDLLEIHDCFTIAELIEYEIVGLCPPGRGRHAIEAGWVTRDGKLPVNPSGGLKAKGHPVGATGVSQHVMAARQLTDTAEGIQIPGATTAGIFNMGGLAVANYATVLERVR